MIGLGLLWKLWITFCNAEIFAFLRHRTGHVFMINTMWWWDLMLIYNTEVFSRSSWNFAKVLMDWMKKGRISLISIEQRFGSCCSKLLMYRSHRYITQKYVHWVRCDRVFWDRLYFWPVWLRASPWVAFEVYRGFRGHQRLWSAVAWVLA